MLFTYKVTLCGLVNLNKIRKKSYKHTQVKQCGNQERKSALLFKKMVGITKRFESVLT